MANLPAPIGPYRLIRLIGEGGMGAVFEAHDERTAVTVALKILLPEYARDCELTQRLFREARALGRLRHPGIVQVFDYGQEPDGTAYVAMEYLRGQTLADWHAERPGPVLAPLALHLGEQLAGALTTAHAKGVVHRDIKPANIMVLDEADGTGPCVKILDFGLAKLAQDTSSHKVKTATDVIMGTPYYMSPEQCQGAGYVGIESDVYSLGVLLFELLSGRLPFDAQGSGRVLAMHMFDEAPRLREVAPAVPGGLADLVHTLLAKEAAQRPSMAVLADELERMIREGSAPTASPLALTLLARRTVPSAASRDTASDRPRGQSIPLKKQRSLIGLGLALVVLLGVVVIVIRPMSVHRRATALSTMLPGPHPLVPALLPSIRWTLTTAPRGATVTRDTDGQVLGKTPWTCEQPRMTGTVALRLRLPGYVDEPLILEQDISQRVHLNLRPQARPQPPAASTAQHRREGSRIPNPKPSAQPVDDFTFEN